MLGEHAGTARSTRAMIVDDDPLARYALRALVEGMDGMTVVAEAGCAQEALERAEASTPDVAVVDIQMADVDGLSLTRELLQKHPALRVLVVSVFPDDPYAVEALRSGALGYIRKWHVTTHLPEAVRTVGRGETYLFPGVAPGLLRRVVQPEHTSPTATLTGREREVLRLLAKGLSNKEIAVELNSTVRTVKAHVSHILRKLNVGDRTQAALVAVRLGATDGSRDDRSALRPAPVDR